MYGTKLKQDENFESLIKRFKKKCFKGNLYEDMSKNEYYTKPSTIKFKRKQLKKFAFKINNFSVLHKKIY